MRKYIVFFLFLGLVIGVGMWAVLTKFSENKNTFFSPIVPKKELPYLKYTIPALRTYPYQSSQIEIGEMTNDYPEYQSFLFYYTTVGKRMSGQLNIPKSVNVDPSVKRPVIVMLRGYVPLEGYQSGMGTKNAAAVFAQQGYITFAPDFFGYGESEADTEDTWLARFQKPVQVIELIKTIRETSDLFYQPIPNANIVNARMDSTKLGLWAHSNGGQIALTTLEALNEPISTTLWAPVTVPFPYSILFFTDENADEGKAARKWIAEFEEEYDVFDFSLTRHLDTLRGPLQLHHGTADEAALKVWSDEFVEKLEKENERREATATTSAEVFEPIEIKYFSYPGADHNMRPTWDQVVQRDVEFFDQFVKKKN